MYLFFPRNSQMVRGTTKSQGEKPCFLPIKFARISYACSLRTMLGVWSVRAERWSRVVSVSSNGWFLKLGYPMKHWTSLGYISLAISGTNLLEVPTIYMRPIFLGTWIPIEYNLYAACIKAHGNSLFVVKILPKPSHNQREVVFRGNTINA